MGTGVQAEESQWPHHFNMMGQLFVGFIFLIAAGMSYMYYYLKGRRAERLRSRAASGVMEGGGVAGLAQMRAKMSGRAAQYTKLDGAESGNGRGATRSGSGASGGGSAL